MSPYESSQSTVSETVDLPTQPIDITAILGSAAAS